ncbi:asparagine synthase (glutamine-hydrolyzing) [Myxococcota bacterium]|nr:asparagine synthase (glutamine-hydrolyzing) [Myxococcota bacterium]
MGYREAGRTEDREILGLRDAMEHRGPDDAGLWISDDSRTGLGHRRLSIIDLSESGQQPMTDASGRWRLVFNGEIYNFHDLRRELEEAGYEFHSTSDTEVVLHGFRAWGVGVLDRLRGMFAFALHDSEKRETLLARDPLGIKPLYVLDDGKRLLFASEVQALRSVCDAGDLDPEALASYLLWGSIAPPRTLYTRIRALPAGSWLRVSDDRVEGPTAYFALEDCFGRSEDMDEEESAEALRNALIDSTRHHLVSDVPVGAFLSGGVDSSALVGLMTAGGTASVRTVTLALDDASLDESALARQAAQQYGTDHREIPIRIDEIRERMPQAVRALDQPSVDGVNTYFVSEAAVRAGLKVAVSGVGGDELFGGYGTFSSIPRINRIHRWLCPVPPFQPLLDGASALIDTLPRSSRASRLSLMLRYGGSPTGAYTAARAIQTPSEVRTLLSPQLADAVEAADPARELTARLAANAVPEPERVSALEFRQYLQTQLLRDTDAVSMRHSLEVRTPLVDRDLLLAVARVPAHHRLAGPAKRRLREAPSPPVPETLWNRQKQGFTLPFDAWFRNGGLPDELPEHPWLRGDSLRAVRNGFRAGHLHFSRLWLLTVLREFLD